MDNKEILYQAIKKAEKNDFNLELFLKRKLQKEFNYSDIEKAIQEDNPTEDEMYFFLYGLIFSHSFAEAFWPNITYCSPVLMVKNLPMKNNCINDLRYIHENESTVIWNGSKWDMAEHIRGWEYYLQQMILEENPLKYLEKFL